MDITESTARAVRFFLKVYLTLLISCTLLQVLASWACSIRVSPGEKLDLWLAFAIVSVVAYFAFRHRHPRPVRSMPRHGSERMPLMPREGGRR